LFFVLLYVYHEEMDILNCYFSYILICQFLYIVSSRLQPLTPAKKREVIQSLIELCERYPIEGVCEFAARVYRRKQAPESFINHYAAVSGTQSRELLLPLE